MSLHGDHEHGAAWRRRQRDVPTRTPQLQLAEQLVEVPTIVSYSLLQLIMEQNVDIPVPSRGGRIAGLQGVHLEQSSTALHVSQERICVQIVEQIVDFPVSGGGLQDFCPGPSSFSSSHDPAGVPKVLDELGEGVFRHLSSKKKRCDVGSALNVGTECGLHFIQRGSSCGLLGRRRQRLDPHRLRARAILEEVAVRPLAVVPAVGRALTAARWLWDMGAALSGC